MRGPARITTGQVAAVHGLILVGVSFVKAAGIVAASRERLQEYVGEDWRRSPTVGVRQMSRNQRRTYRKMIGILGRNRAVEQARAA